MGTLAMDLFLYRRYRREGGEDDFLAWEFAAGVNSWEAASAPAKVGKLLYEGITRRPLSADRARLTTNVMHWAYGIQWGPVFGLAIGSPRLMRRWQGPLLGGLVWLTGYPVLNVAGVYKPIWSYDLKTLWEDLSAHLVYGVGVGAAFSRLPGLIRPS
jgi:hypothetical protein